MARDLAHARHCAAQFSSKALEVIEQNRNCQKMVHKHFLVSGKVQGVGFRHFVLQSARALGITGSVRNLSDGRVEVLAVGEKVALGEFENQLVHGPARPGAFVANVTTSEITAGTVVDGMDPWQNRFQDFRILSDGDQPWPVPIN